MITEYTKEQQKLYAKLTNLEQDVIDGLATGKSPFEAYKASKHCKCTKDTSISVNASRLLKKANVRALYDTFRLPSFNESMMEREKLRQRLLSIINSTHNEITDDDAKAAKVPIEVRTSDINAAIKQYSSMFGLEDQRFHGDTIDLEGMPPLDAIKKITLYFAMGRISDVRTRLLLMAYKMQVDIRNDTEMQETLDNIEKMLEESRMAN